MKVEITPEPSDAERRAIVAALAAAGNEEGRDSPWARALLPRHEDEERQAP